ncbi:MAG: glycosyltransferase family 2 protein [Oscillospiraceae bacterium]|nr:glycosyltransferase family 2 protein [Oscillospiraceae bacterium]
MRKKISVIIPTYNEEENIIPLYEAVRKELVALREKYDYEIVFIDNHSQDGTQGKIRELCAMDNGVKAIFNTRNFGASASSYYGGLQTTGDCTIGMCADFQDPPEMIPKMIEAWENGSKIVCMVKTKSEENSIIRFLRTLYYKFLTSFSNIEIIEHFSQFGIWDKSVLELFHNWDTTGHFIRGMSADLGLSITTIPYTQPKRAKGKSHNNFFTLYNHAMQGITRHTKVALRGATFLGILLCGGSLLVGIVSLIAAWGLSFLAVAVFFLAGVQLFFIGMLGEYVLNIQHYVMKRPLVFEECRLNFEGEDSE